MFKIVLVTLFVSGHTMTFGEKVHLMDANTLDQAMTGMATCATYRHQREFTYHVPAQYDAAVHLCDVEIDPAKSGLRE